MNEWDVRNMIKKEREEKAPTCIDALFILVILGCIMAVLISFGFDYKDLKDNVKQLEQKIQTIEEKK
jgi:hypothetical protein